MNREKEIPKKYRLRPDYTHKFNPEKVKRIIYPILRETFKDLKYQSEQVPSITKDLGNKIRDKLTDSRGVGRKKMRKTKKKKEFGIHSSNVIFGKRQRRVKRVSNFVDPEEVIKDEDDFDNESTEESPEDGLRRRSKQVEMLKRRLSQQVEEQEKQSAEIAAVPDLPDISLEDSATIGFKRERDDDEPEELEEPPTKTRKLVETEIIGETKWDDQKVDLPLPTMSKEKVEKRLKKKKVLGMEKPSPSSGSSCTIL